MQKKLTALIKSFIKPLLIVGLVISLVLSQADGALAARSGGRIGGGSFRAPARSMPSPTRTYRPAPSGGYYPGGGFGLPFIMPYPFIMGGGGLFSILIFMAIAAFLVRSFRSAQSGEDLGYGASPNVSVARVQVGLLSEARGLQSDLNNIANRADTNTSAGLAQVLQESTLALMRHPEYWIYAGGETQQTKLEAAENQFNRLALSERSKFTAETLSNVNNVLKQAETAALPAAGGELVETAPGEYIVVTLLVATQGKLVLPPINSTQDLRQALGQIGSVPSENLMAVEILWTPQAEGDTLTSDDVLAEYPNLKLI
ncbi:MAG: DUF1517 domain-containing protein [Oscillatoriophycideae cyanobacterium NC_groundwater_1537_Pr4_S-0.65um_50_18]|nr:DUF1517 domain-containing protein [Oscillatoriophycideae cyanobacterium NC_groundwater_1537_Pr4_S-0.65um_50_18]